MNSEQAVFEVFDTTMAQSMPDVLGIWTARPIQTGASFAVNAVNATGGEDTPCWRARLPADLRIAIRALYQCEAQLQQMQQALPQVSTRLEAVVQQEASGSAFTVSSIENTPIAEAELLRMLRELEYPSVSFGLGERITDNLKSIAQHFQAFIEHVLKVVHQYALIETHMGEQLLGKTFVSWNGNLSTVWPAHPAPIHVVIHMKMVELVLATRLQLIRIVVLVLRGASLLSLLLSSPLGPVLALPGIWNFINLVLAEYRSIASFNSAVTNRRL